MLVLSREVGQTIMVTVPRATTIKIKVLRIRRDAVRIGLDAPADVTFIREEIADKFPIKPEIKS